MKKATGVLHSCTSIFLSLGLFLHRAIALGLQEVRGVLFSTSLDQRLRPGGGDTSHDFVKLVGYFGEGQLSCPSASSTWGELASVDCTTRHIEGRRESSEAGETMEAQVSGGGPAT